MAPAGAIVLAILLVALSSSFLVPAYDDVAKIDARPPVLFLRPFDEDTAHTYDVIYTGETTVYTEASADQFLISLNAVGPLVSIAKPDWKTQSGMYPGGAYRLVVGGECWQQTVIELLERARLVVLVVGDSPGIEWEIEAVKDHVRRDALLLYLPPRPISALTRSGRENKEKRIYEDFKAMLESRFPVHLPEFREAVYIIGFDKDGEPIVGQSPVQGVSLTNLDRISGQLRRQLREVMGKVVPDADLYKYSIVGRKVAVIRYTLAVLLFFAGIAFSIWSG